MTENFGFRKETIEDDFYLLSFFGNEVVFSG